ncbi:MAG: hypothetical protein RBT41_02630 [Clostridia bacterium]|jgi:hypothetical protein|nr:hypothetical protein [Clostridia bacterium]
MGTLWIDGFLMLIVLGIAFYTLTYAWWLWRQKNKGGAFGVAVLAVFSVLYAGFVLFIIQQ